MWVENGTNGTGKSAQSPSLRFSSVVGLVAYFYFLANSIFVFGVSVRF